MEYGNGDSFTRFILIQIFLKINDQLHYFKETRVPEKERTKHAHFTEPYWSPTHAGGLLAIEKNWFFELGGYDPGIKIWGGEQYELSFKVLETISYASNI